MSEELRTDIEHLLEVFLGKGSACAFLYYLLQGGEGCLLILRLQEVQLGIKSSEKTKELLVVLRKRKLGAH